MLFTIYFMFYRTFSHFDCESKKEHYKSFNRFQTKTIWTSWRNPHFEKSCEYFFLFYYFSLSYFENDFLLWLLSIQNNLNQEQSAQKEMRLYWNHSTGTIIVQFSKQRISTHHSIKRRRTIFYSPHLVNSFPSLMNTFIHRRINRWSWISCVWFCFSIECIIKRHIHIQA